MTERVMCDLVGLFLRCLVLLKVRRLVNLSLSLSVIRIIPFRDLAVYRNVFLNIIESAIHSSAKQLLLYEV
jgi:hypothetical protein